MNIINNGKFMLSSVAGTGAMTIFSHLVSSLKHEQFSEPETLATFIERLMPQIKMRDAKVTAWSLHFVTGLVFALSAIRLTKKKEIKPTLLKGILFGTACGMIGVLLWNTLYNLHPDSPRKDMNKFSGHLMLAHIIYGAVTYMGYQFLSGDQQDDASN